MIYVNKPTHAFFMMMMMLRNIYMITTVIFSTMTLALSRKDKKVYTNYFGVFLFGPLHVK